MAAGSCTPLPMWLHRSSAEGRVCQGSPRRGHLGGSRNSELLPRAPQPEGVRPRPSHPPEGCGHGQAPSCLALLSTQEAAPVGWGRGRASHPSRSPGLRGTQRAERCVLEGGGLQGMAPPHQQLCGRFLVQRVPAGLQDERDQDDRHFPEKIYQTGRLPFSCDLLKPQEIGLS